MKRWRTACPAALLVLAGCGSSRPTSPSVTATPVPSPTPAPAGFQLRAFDGVSGAAIDTPLPAVSPGDGVDLAAAGYLRRRTLAPADGRLFLWPATVDEAYVRAIVYTWSFAGTERLFRWQRRALGVSPVVPGFARAEIASTGAVTLSDAGGAADIDVVVDPSDPDVQQTYTGFTRCNATGFVITHCRVVLRSDAVLQSPVITHELGHTLGLGHSARRSDLMAPAQSVNARFSADERVLVTMMYERRRPGNAPPDDDVALGAARAPSFVFTIRD